MGISKTPNYNLNKPDKGTREWNTHLNQNADLVDAELKRLKDKDATIEGQVNNIVSQAGTSNTEIVDARFSAVKNKSFTTLKGRLDDIETNVSQTAIGYGLEWDKVTDTYKRLGLATGKDRAFFNNLLPWVGMRRCNLSDAGVVTAYYGDVNYKEDGSNGQVMVEIPKFYYRTEKLPDKKYRWFISPTANPGFKVHPTFVRNGVVKDKIYFSAFEGSLYDVSATAYLLADEQVADFTATTGDKLSSIANAKPASGLTQDLTIVKSRILANNRGAGWGQQDFMATSAVQMLLLVEYATLHSQNAIGLGVTNKASGTGNESELTGQTSALGNASGMGAGTNGLVSVSYRGIENFWGNMWKWVDGLNIKADNDSFVADNNFVSDKYDAQYKSLGSKLPNVNGYVSDILFTEAFDYGFLPSEVIGSSSTYLADYYYQSTGNRVARLGGNWAYGSYAGAFCWALSSSSADRSRSLGARLLYVPQ